MMRGFGPMAKLAGGGRSAQGRQVRQGQPQEGQGRPSHPILPGPRSDPLSVSTTKERRKHCDRQAPPHAHGQEEAAHLPRRRGRQPFASRRAVHRDRRHLRASHGAVHHRDRQRPRPRLARQRRPTDRDRAQAARHLRCLGAVRVEPPARSRSPSATHARAVRADRAKKAPAKKAPAKPAPAPRCSPAGEGSRACIGELAGRRSRAPLATPKPKAEARR